MSKFIAVCGAPGCGKTTAALKVAQELYLLNGRRPVLFFSPDLQVPGLGYIFPHRKSADLYSIGEVLERTDVYREDVLKHTVTTKEMEGLGYLGFKAGENKYSYPRPTEDKIRQLFRCMRELAEYVVVDCTSDRADLLSAMARNEADTIIQVASPDLKTMCYFVSNADQFDALPNSTIQIMSILDRDIYLPVTEVDSHFKSITLKLPYSRQIKQQAITGTLTGLVSDPSYRNAAKEIARAVM